MASIRFAVPLLGGLRERQWWPLNIELVSDSSGRGAQHHLPSTTPMNEYMQLLVKRSVPVKTMMVRAMGKPKIAYLQQQAG